jgi:hypothetical protein
MRAITFLSYLSTEDWDFLCNTAAENNTPVAEFAKKLLTDKIAQLRDEVQYIEEMQRQFDVHAERQEKSVEEALA